ncbi:vanadium-dependent haloperoxidase [Roseibium sp.]|uniref:vanadium-dependent haloperoxidase n=1 Tax=Roseibium sp. TaxID=1936156 RepID=UPI003D109F3E
MRSVILRFVLGLSMLSFANSAMADATSEAILAWGEEMRNAEAAAPTPHPATYNSQVGVFYLSVFEAVNASTGAQWETYSGAILPSDARADLAASYAAHAALSAIYGGSTKALDARLETLVKSATDSEIAAAKAVGNAAFDAVNSRHSGVREVFFLTGDDQFMPPPPPAIDSEKYAQDYNQVKDFGGMKSTVRTAEQGEIAKFWSDNRTGTMAAKHFNAEKIIAAAGLEGPEFARSLALFAGGQHDAILSVTASKGVYKTDRPVAAIHKGDTDGNPLTAGDPSWVMFGNNVPPEDLSYSYASGGGTLGSYFANMVGHLIGTDDVTFEYRYLDKPGTRNFERLSDMQAELGQSRIYNGEHFMHDVEAGWRMSKQITDYISSNALMQVSQ